MQLLRDIDVPTLLLDKKKCLANMERMAAKAARNKLAFRPHTKTHQSRVVGQWFRGFGVNAITVSSLKMAHYFAEDGWLDITVAFPLNLRELNRVRELAAKIALNVVVENPEAVEALSREIRHPLNVYLKADTGYHRTGLSPDQSGPIEHIMDQVDAAKWLTFKGFIAHAGHSYRARGVVEIQAFHEESLAEMNRLRERYLDRYPNLVTSIGDTPTCSTMEDFPGITEIRPGNFVFYDLTQYHIGSCKLEDIAVAVACPVVAKHPRRNEIVVYGGGIHFSKDRLQLPDGRIIYGQVVQAEANRWSIPEQPIYVKSLSQEHGIIKATPDLLEKTAIGDLLLVLPVHSCMTADLMKGYLLLDGEQITMMS